MKRTLFFLLIVVCLVFSACSTSAVPSETENMISLTEDITDENDIYICDDRLSLSGQSPFSAGQSFSCGIHAYGYHLPQYGHLRDGDGLFLICADATEMNQGNHYDPIYVFEHGEAKLPRYFFQNTVTVLGQSVTIAFEYTVFQHQIVVTYISENAPYRVHTDIKRNESVLIILDLENDGQYLSYPVFLNPRTGDMDDFLAGIDPAQLPLDGINALAFVSERFVLTRMNDGDYYLLDADASRVVPINSLFPDQTMRCSAVPQGIVCCNSQGDFRILDPVSLAVTEIMPDAAYVEFYYGLTTSCNQTYALYRDEEDRLHYYDFLSLDGGPLSEPAGWRMEEERIYPSYDGRKAFVFCRDANERFQLLIFDCGLQNLILLNRTNENPVTENRVFWNRDGSLTVTSDSDTYFYVYQWKERDTEMIQTQPAVFQPKDTDFVLVKEYIPDLVVEMKYAYPDNFTGHTIYEFEDAWLRYGTVKKLMAVQDILRARGLGLKLWDGFRPVAAQFKLWEILPDDTYVADPNRGFSSHSRGNTVDITLVDSFGREIPMPTDFDDFSTMADRDYSDCPEDLAANAILLETIMQENGFTGYFGEWWHFADSVKYDVETCFDPGIISIWYADCNEYISLRSAPSTSAEVLDRIPVRETCTLYGYQEEFAYVNYRGQRGYVLSAYLKKQ